MKIDVSISAHLSLSLPVNHQYHQILLLSLTLHFARERFLSDFFLLASWLCQLQNPAVLTQPFFLSLFYISVNHWLEKPRQYKAAGTKLGLLFLFRAGLRADT